MPTKKSVSTSCISFSDGRVPSNPIPPVVNGESSGTQALPGAEKLAVDLFNSLDEEQQKVARQPKQFPEIEQAVTFPGVGPARGLTAEKMNQKQRDLLTKLIKDYAGRMPEDVGAFQLERLNKAGFDKIHERFEGDHRLLAAHANE